MGKDKNRDYSTAAFRFYAQVGGSEKYIRDNASDTQQSGKTTGGSPTEAALMAAERIQENRCAEIADLIAVENVLRILDVSGKVDVLKAVKFVYFKDCHKDLERGDIQDRVHYAEIQIPASERQIYRWLRQAREIFAVERRLRL